MLVEDRRRLGKRVSGADRRSARRAFEEWHHCADCCLRESRHIPRSSSWRRKSVSPVSTSVRRRRTHPPRQALPTGPSDPASLQSEAEAATNRGPCDPASRASRWWSLVARLVRPQKLRNALTSIKIRDEWKARLHRNFINV